MSFFNLTMMGYDNRIKSMKRLEPLPGQVNSSQPPPVPTAPDTRSPMAKQLAKEMSGNIQSREWSNPAVSNLSVLVGSFSIKQLFFLSRNYHTLRTMHVRGDQDPNQIYRRPLTAAQESSFNLTRQIPKTISILDFLSHF